ncbi:MAG TPA: hypothetical protein VLL72_02525, partial [Kiloniellales bacterium]|nr:hypothetical protein [Kiloniellales bacterium]
ETFQGWGNAMEKLYNSEEWQKAMKANGLAPFWNGGPEFDTFVNDQIDRIEVLSKEVGLL